MRRGKPERIKEARRAFRENNALELRRVLRETTPARMTSGPGLDFDPLVELEFQKTQVALGMPVDLDRLFRAVEDSVRQQKTEDEIRKEAEDYWKAEVRDGQDAVSDLEKEVKELEAEVERLELEKDQERHRALLQFGSVAADWKAVAESRRVKLRRLKALPRAKSH